MNSNATSGQQFVFTGHFFAFHEGLSTTKRSGGALPGVLVVVSCEKRKYFLRYGSIFGTGVYSDFPLDKNRETKVRTQGNEKWSSAEV